MNLVDEINGAILFPKLILGIYENKSALRGNLAAALEEFQRVLFQLLVFFAAH